MLAKLMELCSNNGEQVSVATRALVLSTFAKFTNLFPEIKEKVQGIFQQDSIIKSFHTEIQQRANEYFHLSTVSNQEVVVQSIIQHAVALLYQNGATHLDSH